MAAFGLTYFSVNETKIENHVKSCEPCQEMLDRVPDILNGPRRVTIGRHLLNEQEAFDILQKIEKFANRGHASSETVFFNGDDSDILTRNHRLISKRRNARHSRMVG